MNSVIETRQREAATPETALFAEKNELPLVGLELATCSTVYCADALPAEPPSSATLCPLCGVLVVHSQLWWEGIQCHMELSLCIVVIQ